MRHGTEFVKIVTRYAYEQTVRVMEHEYQLVTYRLDGVLYTAYLPAEGDLMEKAVRHLDKFWQQIFAYTNNGRYSIDNNIAERCIRSLSGERKNFLFFGSHKMARAFAVYHTVIATCRMNGIISRSSSGRLSVATSDTAGCCHRR